MLFCILELITVKSIFEYAETSTFHRTSGRLLAIIHTH
jgi:hypothetical protein